MPTIVVVDTKKDIVLLKKTLHDYNVVAFDNGKEALDALPSLKPDLVILEMLMPGMPGKEICEQIRKNPATKTLKVMFVTIAKLSDTGKTVLQKLGVVDYVTKPFDKTDLLHRVEKALE